MTAISPTAMVSGMKPKDIRDQLCRIAAELLPVIEEAAHGKERISMQQVQLIKMVFSKVLPDISATAVLHDDTARPNRSLSREELEALDVESTPVPAIEDKTGVSMADLPTTFLVQEERRGRKRR